MAEIQRNKNLVTLTTDNGSQATFDVNYGGICLSLKRNANSVNVISPVAGAGEGLQMVYDYGCDPTAGSANGPMAYPIATRINGSPVDSYYAAESICKVINGQAYYGVTGPAPQFWTAADITENIHVPNPETPDPIGGWNLKYHNIMNFNPSFYDSVECPIVYCNTANENLGCMLLGDEIKQAVDAPYQEAYGSLPWSEKICLVPASTITYRGYISLKNAGGGSWAGVIFRKNLEGIQPNWTRNNVLDAPGYQVAVGKDGACNISRQPGNTFIWSASAALKKEITKTINTDLGTKIELRTVKNQPNVVDIFIDNIWRDTVLVDCYDYSAFGYVAQCFKNGAPGWLKYAYREMFDVSAEFTTMYGTDPSGCFLGSFNYRYKNGTPPPALYRMNNPVAFLNYNLKNYRTAWKWDNTRYTDQELDTIVQGTGCISASQCKAVYTGKKDLTEGIFISLKNIDTIVAAIPKYDNYGSFFIDQSVAAVSAINYENNFNAERFSYGEAQVAFGPYFNAAWL